MKELDGVLRDVRDQGTIGAGATGSAAADAHRTVSVEILRARDGAEERLRDVVAALEKFRLELLRLHAGSGTVGAMTADLTATRAVAEDMVRLVYARSGRRWRTPGRAGRFYRGSISAAVGKAGPG